MKVFNFTNGTKGELLADIKLIDYAGGWLVEKFGSTFKVKLSGAHGGKDDRWGWHANAGHNLNGKDAHIDPKDFGAEAICFCTGEFFHQWHAGHPDAESHWCWNVIGTADWNRSACKSGILKAEKQSA
jgi:hypothetical protein